MAEMNFKLQRFANVVHGDSSRNHLVSAYDNTQVYGLAGNDTIESVNKKNVLLIGGSGNDVLNMTGGTGTLSGGAGADTFNLNYSASATLSAVIEDIEPDKDRIVITYDGGAAPELSYSISGGNVIWSDAEGYFNVTLKSYSSSSDFYDDDCHEYIWDVFWIVNQERERQGLSQLILSQGLNDAASIRAVELDELYSHTRPDGTSCFTAVEKSYWGGGENIYVSPTNPEAAMIGWMNSTGHRANILTSSFKFIGIGYYYYEESTSWKDHWVQMFGGDFGDGTSLTAEEILTTSITSKTGSLPSESISNEIFIGNTYIGGGGNYKITDDFSGTIRIDTDNAVTIDGSAADNLEEIKVLAYSETANLFVKSGGSNSHLIVERASLYGEDISSWESKNYNHVTIDAGAGNDSIENRVFYAVISGGAGNENIKNYSDAVEIFGDADNDIIINGEFFARGGVGVKLYGGNGADTISNSGSNSTLDGGAGNDLIRNGNYYFEPRNANYDSSYNGEHDDSLKSANVKIFGGTGDDEIHNNGDNSTIDGGAGNDSIDNNGERVIYVYNTGDGDDTIFGYGDSDTLKISGSYSTQRSGYSDILINVGSGSILLKNASSKTLNIVSDSETDTTPAGISISGATLTASSAFTGERIDLADYGSSVKILNATALTSAASLIGNSSANRIIGGSGADSLSGDLGNDTLTGNGGADIFVYSDGDDVITDYTPGADKIRLASAPITSATVKGSDVVFKISDGSLTVKNGAGKNITVTDSTGEETVHSFATDTLPAGISVKGATLTATAKFIGNEINLSDYASTVTKVNASALSRGISITGTAANNSLKGGKGADTISGGLGNDTVSLGAGADIYIYSGGNDLIQDYNPSYDKIKLASASITSASISGSNVVLKTSAGNLTVKGGKGKKITVVDVSGNETSQIYPLETLPAGLSYDSAKKVLTVGTSYSGAALDLKDFATTTKTVDASKFAKTLKVTGTSRAESLVGGSKADTLIGGKGNDTLKGNGGNDVFVYSNGDGNDVIADFSTGDKISLVSGSVSSATLKNSDMIFKIGSGAVTVQGGKDKDISIGGAIYHDNLIYDSKKTAVTLGSGFSGTLKASDYYSKTKTINASSSSRTLNIVGNSQANSIFGGSKADTISGGKGNDTLTGNGGKDVFVYGSGDGKDVITDYTAGEDKIKLTSGKITKTSYSGQNVIFTVGTGSITVTNGKGKKITITDAAGKTSTKTYNGTAVYGTSALMVDDNFIGGNTLDEISAEKYSVEQIRATVETEIFAQEMPVYSSTK